MKKIIHSIQNRPDHVKTRLVIIFAVLATAIVVTVWIITLQLLKTPDDTIKTDGPLKVFKEVFKTNVTTVKEQTKSDKNPIDLLKTEKQTTDTEVTLDTFINSDVIMDDSGASTTVSPQTNSDSVQQ